MKFRVYNNDGSALLLDFEIPEIERVAILQLAQPTMAYKEWWSEKEEIITPYDVYLEIRTYDNFDRLISYPTYIKNANLFNGKDVICIGLSRIKNSQEPQITINGGYQRGDFSGDVIDFYCVYDDVDFYRIKIMSNNTLLLYNKIDITDVDYNVIRIDVDLNSDPKQMELILRNTKYVMPDKTIRINFNFFEDDKFKTKLIGLTATPFSNKSIFENGYFGVIAGGLSTHTLYPIYSYTLPISEPTSNTSITCYKNSADSIRVFKHDYLTVSENFAEATPITFLDDCDVINPIISLVTDGKPIDFNYVYLTPLNRYYFVEDIVYKSNNVVELVLKIDILMSNAVGIRSLKAFVTRNEFRHNNSIIDDKRVVHSGTEISTIEIETNLFDDDDVGDGDLGTLAVNGYYIDVT